MSRPLLLALALASLLFAGCGDEVRSTSTKVDLATLAFHALKADDFQSLEPALPTASDTEWMFEKMTASAPQERMERMKASLERGGGAQGVSAKAAERGREEFADARKRAAEVFDWSVATFGGLVAEKSASEDADGVEIADVYFYVDAGERREIFRLARCALAQGRWITTGGLRFRPSPHSSMDQAKVQMTKMRLRMLGDMVRMYELKNGKLPESLDALRPSDSETDDPQPKELLDAWDHPLHLELVDGKVRLASPGPDGELGTEDDVVWPEPDAE